MTARRPTDEALRAARAGIARALLSLSRRRAEYRELLGVARDDDHHLAPALAAVGDSDLSTAEAVIAERPDVAGALLNLVALLNVPPIAWGTEATTTTRPTAGRRGRGRAA
jgi:hypothetical protein